MNLKYFIDRPVLSIVISVAIVFMGIIALGYLPVEKFPDIAPPTIQVFTSYPGANAETVQKSVIVPLEEAINGVEDMVYITSTASNTGDASLNIYFRQGSDANLAAVNVQNRVSTALSLLPSEVTQSGVTTEKQQNAELKTFALYSPTDKYDKQFLNNYVKINVEPRIKRIKGVGNMMLFGSNYSMRIWMKPDKMAQYKLIPNDITTLLAKQNIEASTGSFGENYKSAYQYTMKYRGRLSTPEEFGNLVVRSLPNGEVLRLKEVADIELGDEAYNYTTGVNGHEAAMAMIYQTAGSNASATINEIDATLSEISKELPEGLEFVTLSDTNRFLYASIREVLKTLLEAILLVIFIVYIFLQDIRSTLIPTISIFVSIIGTFAAMALLGFSINLLTLFALILAIGTVVDDAIVVVEAVQARFDAGYKSSYRAANDAMRSISSAIFTSTLIFMVVFIPVAFMGGTSGTFYKQFGLTMAIAVGISAINAFTLSPVLCALMLKPYMDEAGNTKNNFAARFRLSFNAVFDALSQKYVRGVLAFIKRKWLMWSALATAIVLLLVLIRTTKTGLIPDEDTGSVMISMTSRPGTSMHTNKLMMNRLDSAIFEIPGIEYHSNVAGFSFDGAGPSMGMYFIALRDWSQRKENELSAYHIMEKINELTSIVPDAQFNVMSSPMVDGYGMGNGFEVYLQDKSAGDITAFKGVADNFVEELSKRKEIENVYSAFQIDYPQFWVDIDAAQCEKSGISPNDILQTLADYYSGSYVSNFNRFSKLYRVMIQAAPSYRVTAESLNHLYVRTANEMAPLSRFVKLTKTYGPSDLTRFNLYNAISVSGTAAVGYSAGDALKAINETANKVLPQNYGYEYSGISREVSKTSNNVIIIFSICLLFMYIILCGLYESFFMPFAILLSIPFGLFGCFLFTKLFGLENNIYMQTGLIMLIGLLAKTAILLTEYATERRNAGMSLVQAAYSAAKIRLRPILMTALTMVFGLFPLMIAHGVGANGNRSLATGAVGGMLIGTLAILFIVPSLFICFKYLEERYMPKRKLSENRDLDK